MIAIELGDFYPSVADAAGAIVAKNIGECLERAKLERAGMTHDARQRMNLGNN